MRELREMMLCSRRTLFVKVTRIHIIETLATDPLLQGMIYLKHVVSQFLIVKFTTIVIGRYTISG